MDSQSLMHRMGGRAMARTLRNLIVCVVLGLFTQPAAAEMYLVWSCPSATLNGAVTACPSNDASWNRGGVGTIVASATAPGAFATGTWRRWEDVQPDQYVYTCMAERKRLEGAGCPAGSSASEAYALKSFVGPVPSAKIGTARLISPSAATAYFGGGTTSTNQLALARPKEIVELARALSNDPQKINDFVRNSIETTWTYGLQKGALGTLLDRHGTTFDQAHLMVELLRQAGFTANYEFGTLAVSAANFTAWSGVTTQRAACELLSGGGIPAVVGTSGNAYDCSTLGAATALPGTITLAHVWVSVVISGDTYRYNPSYKTHTFHAGINLPAQMGFTVGQTFSSTSSGMSSGTASGVGYVSNLNAETLNSTLQSYGTTLLSNIQNNYSDKSVEELVGAAEIEWVDQTTVPPGSSLPGSTASATWTAIPDQYRTRLRVELSKTFPDATAPLGADRRRIIDTQLFVDEIYGRKLVATPNYPIGTQTRLAGFNIQLRVMDKASTLATVASYTHPSSTDLAPMRDGTIRLTANHPYAASGTPGETVATGTYMDRVSEKYVFMFTPFTILHGWGYADDGLAEAWGPRLDTAAPNPPSGEFGCDACEQLYYSSLGDARREQMAASWMIQSSRAAELHANIARSIYVNHHSLGVASADSFPEGVDLIPSSSSPVYFVIGDSFDRIDVDSAYSLTSKNSNTTERRAAIAAIAAISEALEGSVAEQVADLPDVASTATRFEWGNRPVVGEDMNAGTQTPVSVPVPRRFYRFNSGNASESLNLARLEGATTTSNDGQFPSVGSGEPEISNAEMGTRRAALSNAIRMYTQAGYDVISAEDAFLGPGQRGGMLRMLTSTAGSHTTSEQRSGALVATRYDGTGDPVEISHILVGYDELSKGGGGGTQANHQSRYDPAEAADVLKARFADRSSAVGVDLTKGQVTYEAPAKISVGNGGFPYELSASLIWRGGNEVSEQFGPIVHTQPQTPWTTNWNNTLNVSSSALEAMGATDARAAAGTIAAFVAQQDVYKATASAQRDVAAVLVGAWLMKQISGNVVSVTVGAGTRQFVRNVAGSWFSPGPGTHAVLLQAGTRTKYVAGSCGEPRWTHSRGWDYSGITFTVRNAQSDDQVFSHWNNTYSTAAGGACAKMKGFRLSSWTFPQGMAVNFVYTSPGSGFLDRLTEVNNSLGRRIRFNYTTYGALTGFDNGLSGGDLRSVLLSSSGGLQTIQDPAGAITRFKTSLVDQQHRLEEVYDADDTTVPSLRYTFDSLHRVKEARDAEALQAGPRNPYEFFIAEGARGERLDPAGGRYTVLFDSHKRPFRHIDEIDRLTTISYDGRGRIKEYQYPDLDKEVFSYDSRNNPTLLRKVNKPGDDWLDVTADWHPTWNKPNWVQDANGNRTDFVYYASGNGTSMLQTATRPADEDGMRPVYSYTYNSRGQVLNSTDPTGLVTANGYHPTNGNLLTAALNPSGINAISSFGYDGIGDVTSVTDPRSYVSENVYDNDRRKTITKNHDGNIAAAVIAAQRTTYDLLGQVTKEEAGTAFSGTSVTTWQAIKDVTYTRTGRVRTEANGAGNTVTTSYDPMDRVLQIEDPVLRRTRFQYDLAGQVLKEIRAWGTAVQQDHATYSYNPNGKRTSITDAKNNRTEFEYDRYDRLNYTIFPMPAVGANQANTNDLEQYEYDNNGNRILVMKRDGKGIVTQYDALNREINKIFPEGDGSTNVQTKYDLAGRPAWKRFSSTNTGIDYGYDTAKRLITETSYGRTMTYGYDLAGNRTSVQWPDTNYISYSFDALNRMTQVRENSATPGVNVLQTYYWDPLSRRSATTPLSRGNSTYTGYAYDSASRLTGMSQDLAATSQDFALGFSYTAASQMQARTTSNDALGWWVAPESVHSYAVNGLNQYTSLNGVTYTNDPNGNLTSDGSRTFAYDTENRLITVGGTSNLTLAYDPLGRLKQTTSGATTTSFLYDGDRLVAEYNGSGTLLRRYVHGAGLDEPIVWYEGASLGTKYWLHGDERGSVVAYTDINGAATAYQYGPFGEQPSWTGSRFRYTGQIMLPEAQLYHYKARVYDPKIGRFLQTDPIGYDDDFNLYAYVGNDPLNKTDPTGMFESYWLLRALVPGQITYDNAMTAAENGNYGRAGALMGAMVGEQVLTVASFGAASAATPVVQTFETAAASASELNASRGLSARMGGIVFHGHHPIPKVLGGPSSQALETLTAGLHGKFHSMLGESLKRGGFDLPIGGKRGSAQAWSRYFSENPGSQKRAQDIVRQTSKAFDKQYGTDLAGAAKQMCTGSRIAKTSC